MATRWTSKHTGQKIDDTIDYVCNSNLLDNWYFGNPVNQRGQTSYTGAGYGIDRWYLEQSYNLKIDATGLHFTPSSPESFTNFIQKITTEEFATLNGKTITVSVLTSDGKLMYASGIWTPKGGPAVHCDNFEFSSAAFVNAQSYQLGRLYVYAGKSADVLAVKVELGSTQTLAHQENGVWVLNEIPDYGEQLARCQGYQLIFGAGYEPIGIGQATASNAVEIYVPTPATFRKIPVVSGRLYLRNGGEFTEVSSVAVEKMSPNSVRLIVAANATAGMAYEAFTTENDKLILDANL